MSGRWRSRRNAKCQNALRWNVVVWKSISQISVMVTKGFSYPVSKVPNVSTLIPSNGDLICSSICIFNSGIGGPSEHVYQSIDPCRTFELWLISMCPPLIVFCHNCSRFDSNFLDCRLQLQASRKAMSYVGNFGYGTVLVASSSKFNCAFASNLVVSRVVTSRKKKFIKKN